MKLWFQHTAAETRHIALAVSTHSRLKAADRYFIHIKITCIVSTHSRLEAAEGNRARLPDIQAVSTHSRLEAAEE